MTAPSANLSANYEAFQGPPSRRPFLRKPSSAARRFLPCLIATAKRSRGRSKHCWDAVQKHSNPVKPQALGLIGKAHLLGCLNAIGGEVETFRYQKALGATEGLPWVVETAFGWCPKLSRRRIVVGINWSVALGNPFQAFYRYGGEGLESLLAQQRAGRYEPIVFVLHYVCPRVGYSDRGKSAVILPGTSQ